jgi:hypothetical protein
MTYDYRDAFWEAWRGPLDGPLKSVFADGATVDAHMVELAREEGSTWHLAEMALYGDHETRLAAIRALGAFDDTIAQVTLAAIGMDDPDDVLQSEAAKTSSRIYDRLTGA